MGIELARAYVVARGDASSVASDLGKARPAVEAMAEKLSPVVVPRADLSTLESELRQIKPMMESLANDIKAGMVAVLAPIGALGTSQIFKGLQEAGGIEQTMIAFETMIGSAEETKKTLEGLTQFAAKTPFEMPEILQAARGLIQFGERGEEMLDTLRILGNAAAGTSSSFGDLALIFNQIRGVGKLLTQDFRQLATRGVISLQDIADYYGVTRDAAQEMLSEGKVGFGDLRNILKGMSEEGGRFFNMMEKQSTSYLGLLSTLRDNLNMVSSEIGKGLLPMIKGFVSWVIEASGWVRNWIEQNRGLATSLTASITLVSSLGASLLAGSLAAKVFGISLKGALIGTGIGAALVAVGALVGWLVDRFQLFEKIGPLLDQVAATFDGWKENIRIGWQMLKDVSSEAWEGIVVTTKEFMQSFSELIDTWFGPIIEKIKVWFVTAKEWIEPWKNMFVDAFKDLVKSLDTMLGSWEGLRSGIIYYAQQAKLGFQAIWESVKNWFREKIEVMKGFFQKLWAKIFSSKEEQEALQKRIDDRLRQIREEHEKRMAEIGEESLRSLQEWERKMGSLPKLSEEVGAAWDEAKNKIQQEDFQKKVGEQVSGAFGWVRDMLSSLPGKATDLASKVKGMFESTLPKAEEVTEEKKEEKKEEKELVGSGRFGFLEYARSLQDAFLKPDDAAKSTAENTARTAVGVEQMAESMNKFLTQHGGFLSSLSSGGFLEAGQKLPIESLLERPPEQKRTEEKAELERHTKLLQELISTAKNAWKLQTAVYGD